MNILERRFDPSKDKKYFEHWVNQGWNPMEVSYRSQRSKYADSKMEELKTAFDIAQVETIIKKNKNIDHSNWDERVKEWNNLYEDFRLCYGVVFDLNIDFHNYDLDNFADYRANKAEWFLNGIGNAFEIEGVVEYNDGEWSVFELLEELLKDLKDGIDSEILQNDLINFRKKYLITQNRKQRQQRIRRLLTTN